MRSLQRAFQSCLDPRRTGTTVLPVIFNALDRTGHLSVRLQSCCRFRDIPSDASGFYRYNYLEYIFRKEVCILSKLTCKLKIWVLCFMPTPSSLTVLLGGGGFAESVCAVGSRHRTHGLGRLLEIPYMFVGVTFP